MFSWYTNTIMAEGSQVETSQLVAFCTCQERQSDRRTLLHLSYLLSQE